MKIQLSVVFLLIILFFSSCISKKKYYELQQSQDEIKLALLDKEDQLRDCENEKRDVKSELSLMKKENESLNSKVDELRDRLEGEKELAKRYIKMLEDVQALSAKDADMLEETIDALNTKDRYIQELSRASMRKDSLNYLLVQNLKRSLDDVNDPDVNIEVKGTVVLISLSDKMLFQSGSYILTDRANEVLGKVAKVINDHKELDVVVEGHTDSIPISNNCLKDNWDLSAMRSTSVVRTLQQNYGVKPSRLSAAGRSEFVPKVSNETPEGRSINRRTEIIILPKLNQFFELLKQQPGE